MVDNRFKSATTINESAAHPHEPVRGVARRV
jgi:hypothetical protein